MPRLERGREGETAPGNPHPAGWTIRSGATEFGLLLIDHFEAVVRVVGDDTQSVTGPYGRQVQFLSVLVAVLFHETFPIRGHGKVLHTLSDNAAECEWESRECQCQPKGVDPD